MISRRHGSNAQVAHLVRFSGLENERGSTMVETTIAASTVVVIILGLTMIGYVAFAKAWIQHSSYEAVICLAAQTNTKQCHHELQLKIGRLLPSARLTNVQLARSPREASVRFRLSLFDELSVNEKRQMRLPLKISGAGKSWH